MSRNLQPVETFSPSLDSEGLRQTEISLLGEIVEGNVGFAEVESLGLRAEGFNSETHRLVFEAMKRLHVRGAPIDHLNLATELETNDERRPDGGAWSSYITSVLDVALPIGNVEYHVRQIREGSRLRRLSEAGLRLHEAALKGDAEAVREWTERITGLRGQTEADNGASCITLANHVPKPKQWIIDGVVPDCFPSMIYGAGGMGKSFLSTYLGIEACRGGRSFIGHPFPEEPLNTLIIDYELDADVQAERAQNIARGLNLAGIPENLHYYAPTKSANSALPEIRSLIKRHSIRFVIIDSWGGSGVDGGDPKDTTAFLTELRNLNIATLILDHQAKTQSGESYDNKTAFGTVYKSNMSRSVFQLSKNGEGKNPMTLRLRHKKSNFGPLGDDIVFDVNFEGDRILFTQSNAPNPEERDCELIAEALEKLEATGVRVNQKALAEYLEGVIGQKRLRLLLESRDGERWESYPGDRKEKLYKPKTAKRQPFSKHHFAVLRNAVEDVEDCDCPEVLNG